jgi:ketosteroid isomerase-like protein
LLVADRSFFDALVSGDSAAVRALLEDDFVIVSV